MDFKSVFDANPTAEVLYGFEDGNAFIKQGEADSHKKNTGKNYEVIKKSDSVKMEDSELINAEYSENNQNNKNNQKRK